MKWGQIPCRAAEEEVLHGKWPAFSNQVLTELGLVVSQNAVFPGLVSPKVVLYSLDVIRDCVRICCCLYLEDVTKRPKT